ncbi:subtype I-C CRISPR-associated endonuclease Cas1 [candidate division TA06 bacterium B3_TA06]|uniref:CRISPR-associated endonuclease Cas1 n=1 Tax=candidate division TA06 bacterium B3_TA06 TaxID=2012487 RepID=A0A532V173_UNCT6|nr:MAG: subtype I-C CRISPR-associated endonuclease Cas1 [candidate division TA06 bacterium B3_TA06]
MKRLLNTLFVTTQGAYLCREGETVVVRADHETKLQVPIHTLSGIVCFGRVSCSPPLMGLCGERGVLISFHSEYGKFLARMHGPVSGNVLLRREQYRRADDPQSSSDIARSVVLAKISNCRTVLQRTLRDHPSNPNASALKKAAGSLARLLITLQESIALDVVRGREGEAARIYFNVFEHLILAQKDHFYFRDRSKRPPLDPMNALLSFLYAILAHDVTYALESVGLDPAVGFLHRDRPGRPGLALDLMEEFRPILADRVALSLVNRQQVKGKGFKRTETGAVLMDNKTRKEVLVAYQKRKTEEIQHPFIGEKVAVGLLPYVQALLMARFLRGDLDGYPPFIWR